MPPSGLCAGINSLIGQVVPNYADIPALALISTLLGLMNTCFLGYLTAWVGYRAAEKFGGTPILGGMLGMITGLEGINKISSILGLFNEAVPLDSILRAGRGGVLAVVLGAWCLVKIERWVRKWMPESLDIVFTPLITMILCLVPYILIIMPATGYVSTALCWVVEKLCMSDILIVRIIAGYVSTALFLPMVAMGMHHGLVALYSVQLESFGYVTLYPALAMAGAGQVGAAVAIYFKAKKCGNTRLKNVITGALPAGLLGIGGQALHQCRSGCWFRRCLRHGHAGGCYCLGPLRSAGSVRHDRRPSRCGCFCWLLRSGSGHLLHHGLYCDQRNGLC